jgi:TRAP-type mannitol/chloroaromatic compound transport system permease large subunit
VVKATDLDPGSAPFVVIQLVGLAVVATFPALATWLPSVIFH